VNFTIHDRAPPKRVVQYNPLQLQVLWRKRQSILKFKNDLEKGKFIVKWRRKITDLNF